MYVCKLIANLLYRMPLTDEQINVLKIYGAELTQFIDIENGLLTKLYAADVITNAQKDDINSQVRSILSTV